MKNAVWLVLCMAVTAPAQDKPKPIAAHPKVDQEKVDAAIESGCKTILFATGEFQHGKRFQPPAMQSHLELTVLTLAHSGFYPEDNPQMQGLVEQMLKKKIASTYTAALQAMALQKINPKKYQWRIAQCAQFLVDNQADNGQWDYGAPVDVEQYKEPPPTPKEAPVIGTGGTPAFSKKAESKGTQPGSTQVIPKLPRIPIPKRGKAPPAGDNSNTQYASLGIRACLDAGMVLPTETLGRGRAWWIKSQNKDGGWGYNDSGNIDGAPGADDSVGNSSYGSMTVGGTGALCIYDFYMGTDYKTDPAVLKGVQWLASNYDVKKNPKKTSFAYMYYLYGLERAGILFGTEKFGNNEWYVDGALHLLATQQGGGAWHFNERFPKESNVDTCFAILFLRRGMAPLKKEPERKIATGAAPGADGRAPLIDAGGGVKPVENPGAAAPAANPVVPAPAPGAGAGALQGNQLINVANAFVGFAPGWSISQCGAGPGVPGTEPGLKSAFGSKQNVFLTYPPNRNAACSLTTNLSVPTDKRTMLRIVAGYYPGSEWILVVRFGGAEVFRKQINSGASPQEYFSEFNVDLTPFVGKTGQLEVQQFFGLLLDAPAYWSKLEVKSD